MQSTIAITRSLDERLRCGDELNEDRATPGAEGTTTTQLLIDNAVVDVESSLRPRRRRVCIDQTASRTARDLPFSPATQVSGAVQLFPSNVTSRRQNGMMPEQATHISAGVSGCSKIG
jgi:hypothetical protein